MFTHIQGEYCLFQMQILLQTWPELEPEQALELLDYTFADQEVRKIAVKCVKKMRWVGGWMDGLMGGWMKNE